MRKTHILTTSAVLLFCAVLCTAGCIGGSDDVIVGDYSAETENTFTYVVFYGNGNGDYISMVGDDKTVDKSQISFFWSANEEGTYSLQFIDGRKEICTLDAENGLLTIAGMELVKGPSLLSENPEGIIDLDPVW